MKWYQRVMLGAIVFGIIGPLMIAAGFATSTVVVVGLYDYEGIGDILLGWLGTFAFAALVALGAGAAPAAVVGVFVGALATHLRRRYLYLCAVVCAVVVGLLFFAVVTNPGDGPIVIGAGFSIPVTVVLSRLLLAIIRRFNHRSVYCGQAAGERL